MNGVWEKLCPIFVNDFPGFAKLQAEEQNAVDSLVSISQKLDLDLEENDFHDFVLVRAGK